MSAIYFHLSSCPQSPAYPASCLLALSSLLCTHPCSCSLNSMITWFYPKLCFLSVSPKQLNWLEKTPQSRWQGTCYVHVPKAQKALSSSRWLSETPRNLSRVKSPIREMMEETQGLRRPNWCLVQNCLSLITLSQYFHGSRAKKKYPNSYIFHLLVDMNSLNQAQTPKDFL